MKIGFTGDLSFSGHFKGAHLDNDLMDPAIKSFFAANDHNVINFESPITPCKITRKKRLAHRCDPETLGFVQSNIKNPVLSFANNHMMDFSYIGLIDSLESAEKWGMPYIGAGTNVDDAGRYVILGDEIKAGIIGVQYKKYKVAGKRKAGPLHESKTDVIKQKIREIKEQADYTVMVYHGGDEFFHVPMPYMRKQLKSYLDWGCDIVVAHHPHVVQGYEMLGEKAIFYSLGNFIFDTDYQRVQEDTDKGIIISIDFRKDGFSFDKMATLIDRVERKILVRDDDEYFTDLREINYSKAWCLEAYRRKDIKSRAAELKEQELLEAEDAKVAEEEQVEELRRGAEIKKYGAIDTADELTGDDPDEEVEDEEKIPGVNVRINLYGNTRKIYKSFFKDTKGRYRSTVVKWGGQKARLFYAKSIK